MWILGSQTWPPLVVENIRLVPPHCFTYHRNQSADTSWGSEVTFTLTKSVANSLAVLQLNIHGQYLKVFNDLHSMITLKEPKQFKKGFWTTTSWEKFIIIIGTHLGTGIFIQMKGSLPVCWWNSVKCQEKIDGCLSPSSLGNDWHSNLGIFAIWLILRKV